MGEESELAKKIRERNEEMDRRAREEAAKKGGK